MRLTPRHHARPDCSVVNADGSRRLRKVAPAGPAFELAGQQAIAWRVRSAIEALERAGAVQGMQPTAGPLGSGTDDGMNALRIVLRIEAQHFRQPDAGPVAGAAILHRTPQLVLPSHERTRRPCTALVHHDGIAGMRFPRAAQMRRMEDRERVRVRAAAVLGRDEHPEASRMLDESRVAGHQPGQEIRFLDPAVRKALRAIERDGRVGAALRDHPDLPVALEHERIRQVPGLLEHDPRWPARTELVERDDRDHAFFGAVIQVLDEDMEAALVHERKRVGVEVRSRIRQHLPRGAGQRPVVPKIGSVDESPADAPVRRVAAQMIEPTQRRMRQ